MHPRTSTPRTDSRRGSTIAVVMVIAVALAAIVAGLLSTMITDKRVNSSLSLLDEARNAAEGATEIAVAEFDRRARSFSTIPDTPLAGFTIPTEAADRLAVGNVVSGSIAFKAGNISPMPDMPITIDPSDPFNSSDPDKAKPVSMRLVYIYGKAAARNPTTGEVVNRYVSTLVQVRTQSWLNYGIFGNLDLEFHAGPNFDVYGPIHSNNNIYVLAGGGSNLRFYAGATTPRRIIRGFKDGGSTSNHGGSVHFANKLNPTSGELVSMSTSQDSRMTGFEDFARTRWNGFVQDISFDVQAIYPPGMPSYVEDNYTTTGENETRNHAYALIEPQLSTSIVDDITTATYAGHKGNDVEDLKVSAVAGLLIRVKTPPSDAAAAATYWANTRLDNDHVDFEPGFELVTLVPQDTSRPLNRNNLPRRGSDGRALEQAIPIAPSRMSAAQRNRLFAAIKLVEYLETGTAGNSDLTPTTFVAEDVADVDPATATTNRTWYPIHDRRQGYQYSDSSGATNNLGYRGAHHALHIDLGAFNTFLNAPEADWYDLANPTDMLYTPNRQYSGAIYVQFPLQPYTGSVLARRTTDHIRPAIAGTQTTKGYALILRNGSILPGLPSAPSVRDDGLVIGTNGPAYILGHFNADGSSSTGSSSTPDTGHPEVPALIAADSVTILSNNYATNSDYFRDSAKPKRGAAFTEISAAIFAGIIPTRLTVSGAGTNGQRMGGVHNYLRLLEDWSGQTYRYRGSFGLLFESEVHLRPYYENHHGYWYGAPTRDTGYHQFFANGKLPPAWPPFVRTDRRITVDDITAAQWDLGPPTPPKTAVK